MDTNVIHCIITVAESGSISAAARKLFLSQPALTKQISKLESQIGIRIFDRSKTPVTVTAEGAVFLDFAVKYVELERNMMERLGERQPAAERVLVATTPRGGQYAGSHTAAFLGTNQGVQVEYLDMNTIRCEEALEKDEVDIAIYTDPVLSDQIEYMPLEEDPLVLLVPWDNALVAGRDLGGNSLANPLALKPEELRGADLTYILSTDNHSLAYAENAFLKKYRITPARSFRVDFVNTRYSIACGGGGAVLVPHATVKEEDSAGKVVYCTIDGENLYRYVIIAKKRGKALTRGAETFWRFMVGQRFRTP